MYEEKMKMYVTFVRYFAITVVLILAFPLRKVHSISCFRCDSLEKKTGDCPGWNRVPVNSVTNLGDMNGFYTHCLDVRIASDNTVIHQNVIPHRPTCRSDFIKIWKSSLESQLKTNITITCCGTNACNGPGLIKSSAVKKIYNYKVPHVLLLCMCILWLIGFSWCYLMRIV